MLFAKTDDVVAAACDDVMHCNIDAANVSVDNPLIKQAHQAASSS